MTDQPQQPGVPGNSGSWQPVPGGGDYDPDQTMHVSFAAQLPPAPAPGEDPLAAHGPVGEGDAVTQWTIPVIRDEPEGDSGEFPAGAFTSQWDQAPSPAAPTQSFPAGMFGQGAAAAQAAQAARAPAEAAGPGTEWSPFSGGEAPRPPVEAAGPGTEWSPFSGGGGALPWQPVDPAAAEAAWSSAVDDPERAGEGARASDGPERAGEGARASDGFASAVDGPERAGEGARASDGFAGPVAPDGPSDAPEPGTDALDPADGPPDAPEPSPEAEVPPEPEAEPEPTRSEHPLASYLLRVNGSERPVTDAWLGESLLYVLRERLGLAGAKDGCEQGECGACSVQVDGRLVASCLVPAATAAGSEVRTVEGLSVDGRPSDVQRALAESGAVQCGFCIPGMAMTVHDLLEGNHRPSELETRQALCGNLCRCSGYRGVVEAVRQVVAARDTEDPPPAEDAAPRIPHQAAPGAPA